MSFSDLGALTGRSAKGLERSGAISKTYGKDGYKATRLLVRLKTLIGFGMSLEFTVELFLQRQTYISGCRFIVDARLGPAE